MSKSLCLLDDVDTSTLVDRGIEETVSALGPRPRHIATWEHLVATSRPFVIVSLMSEVLVKEIVEPYPFAGQKRLVGLNEHDGRRRGLHYDLKMSSKASGKQSVSYASTY